MQYILKNTSRYSTLFNCCSSKFNIDSSLLSNRLVSSCYYSTKKNNSNTTSSPTTKKSSSDSVSFKPQSVYTNEIGGIVPKSVAHSQIKNNWMKRQMTDNYVKKAYADKMISRAAYKLINIDDAIGLFKPGMVVIDLGSAPGGWTKAAMLRTNPKGIVISCDLRSDMQVNFDNFIHGDFAQDQVRDRIRELIIKRKREFYFKHEVNSNSNNSNNNSEDNNYIDKQVPPSAPTTHNVSEVDINAQYGKADVVVSDMAPPYCGTRSVDHARLMALAEFALDFAETVLKKGGSFVCKVSRGGDEKKFLKILESKFMSVKSMKPDASRPESTEIYYIGRNYLLDNSTKK